MKLGACVVLYEHTPEKINTFAPICDCVVAVDNGNNAVPEGIHRIFMGGNKGIAAALNAGFEYLIKQGCDVVLTMDDDSSFPLADAPAILPIVENRLGEYGILGLNFNYSPEKKTDAVINVRNWLTSGNFVSTNAWKSVGGYREELFIDYVDFDFCTRLEQVGYKVGYLRDYSIEHKIGDPIEFRLIGRTFHAMNHSPIRDYYRYRNARFLSRENPQAFEIEYLKELFWQLLKMLLFEDNKAEKLRMIRKGIADGKKGNLGKYSSQQRGMSSEQ